MYIRFVIAAKDDHSGKRQGLFQAMSELKETGRLLDHEEEQYEEIYSWFRFNLKKPLSFSRSSKPHARNIAISWFKDSAKRHIAKMHEVVSILRDHGIHTETLRTRRPGYIVYEDEFQISAEPFTETLA